MGRLRFPTVDPPKNLKPKGWRCIQFMIPDDDEWEHLAYSVLYDQLARTWTNWGRTGDDTGSKLCQIWRKALKTWTHCKTELDTAYVGLEDDMPFFREVCENGKCYLEFQCCPDEWIRIANSDQIVAPANSPGDGVPQPPPGQSQQICGTIYANQPGIIPFPLNSGDQISIQATGSGNDGGEVAWRCPDGSTYFAGACVPLTGHVDLSDPLPTALHMALILKVGTNYYDLTNPVTIPSGVSNAQGTIQANDSDLSNNSGSYQVCTTYQNNQAPTWTQEFDFALSSTTVWTPINVDAGAPLGVWNAGQGWHSVAASSGGTPIQAVELQSSTAINHLSNVTVNLIYQNSDHVSTFSAVGVLVNGTLELGKNTPYADGSHTESVDLSIDSVTDIKVYVQSCPDSTCTIPGSGLIAKITLSGTGTNPFA